MSAVRRQIEMKMIGSSSAISGRYNIKTTGMAGPRRLRRRTRTKRRETGVLSLGKDTLGYDHMAEDKETGRYVSRLRWTTGTTARCSYVTGGDGTTSNVPSTAAL